MLEDHDLAASSVFISGPMTGVYLNNVREFAAVHARLKKLHVSEVFNPAVEWLLEKGSGSHEYYMRKCISRLTQVKWDYIVMLPGWEESAGATLEHDVAVACGITVIEADA